MALTKQKLELTWIGKEKHHWLEPCILLEDLEADMARQLGADGDRFHGLGGPK